MSGSGLGASKTPEDEWENRWLRAWVPPPEPELYSGVHELAGLLVYKDCPELRPKRRPGEVRQVWRPLDIVCVHDVFLDTPCEECETAHRAPRKDSWWRRLLSR